MKIGYSSGTSFKPESLLRLGLTMIITFMIVLSPILILFNPTLVVATKSSMMDTSNNHATVSTSLDTITESSPSTTVGTPTIQAALSSLTARPTNNIVNTNSFYDVVFLTATAGAIKTIQVTFPAGTTIPSGAFFNEAEGIGPGTASKSGQTITYTVTNAVNVPAGTKIRLEFANINNPLSPSANYKVTVTTRNAANAIVDGPTQSTVYTMKQIGVNAIADLSITNPKLAPNSVGTSKYADNSITSTKPALSFMKRVNVQDTPAGHAVGWDPNGATTFFAISEPEISFLDSAFTSIFVRDNDINHFCDIVDQPGFVGGIFEFSCATPPSEGAELHYVVENLPDHDIS